MPTDCGGPLAVCCTYIHVAHKLYTLMILEALLGCAAVWTDVASLQQNHSTVKLKLLTNGNWRGSKSGFTASSWTRNTTKVFWAGTFCANLGWRQDRAITRKSRIHGEMSGDITWEFHGVLILITHWDSAALSSYLDSKLRDDNQCRFYLITAWGCEQSSILKIIGKWVLTVASQK